MLKKEVQSKEELHECHCYLTEQYVDFIVEPICTCKKLVKNAQKFVPFAQKTSKRHFYETMGSIADGTSFFDFSMINSFADLKETIINPFLDEWNQNVNFDEMDFMRYYSSYLEYILVKFPKPQSDIEAYFGMIVSQFDERSYFLLAKHGKGAQIFQVTSNHKEYLEEYQGEIDIDAFRKYILDNYYPHPPLSEAEVEAIFQEGELFYMDDQYDKAVTCFKKTTGRMGSRDELKTWD